MSEIPYLPLYVNDFEGDTAHLNLEEDGAYNRLIRLCWRTPTCSIPNDPKWIIKRLRIDQAQYDDVVKPIIEDYFTIKKGRVFQKRLQKEFDKISNTILERKKAGKKGGNAKALNNSKKDPSNTNVLPLAKSYHPEPYLEPDLEVDKEEKKKHAKKEIWFEDFWNNFADKRGKSDALNSWLKIKILDEDLADQIIQGAKDYAKHRDNVLTPNKSTPKMAQGWLSGKRWEDELPKYKNGHSETCADFGAEETDDIVIKSYAGEEARDLFK